MERSANALRGRVLTLFHNPPLRWSPSSPLHPPAMRAWPVYRISQGHLCLGNDNPLATLTPAIVHDLNQHDILDSCAAAPPSLILGVRFVLLLGLVGQHLLGNRFQGLEVYLGIIFHTDHVALLEVGAGAALDRLNNPVGLGTNVGLGGQFFPQARLHIAYGLSQQPP